MSTDLDWLYARQRVGIHPGLTRVRALLQRLGDPQQAFRAVLVGGTNGKGSTSATLASMLTAGGQRTGLFTSPHLTHFQERFLVDGQELPEATVLAALGRVRPLAEGLEASFFEIVVALGCVLFAEAGVELAVMEVGLGGRLDATNALEPVLSVITSVGLDHTDLLGHTHEAIATEKAGILRTGRPAVTGVAAALWPLLDRRGADLWALDREAQLEARPLGWSGWEVRLRSPGGLLSFQTPLLGEHGARNAALAALAAQRLGLDEAAIATGARTVRWPGRMERLSWQGREVLLDGAHNPDGAAALSAALQALAVPPLPFVFGSAADKDVAGVVEQLRPVMASVILTRAQLSPRAADPASLAPLFQVPVQLAGSPQEALGLLPPGLSVACGSLYLIGELRPLLLGEAAGTRERWQ
ncbi:folylpolyglutamate synthase/dihydrofolate synthase family protein [Deinococcus sonorensis]|uniref:tetrahydrofolate synthase n=2 Tax=Deinococcus sonorensis TaxID=309891 RepID=A0AAU7UCL4_9DEIO